MEGDRTVGTVNIYGRTADAFVGRHEALAAAVGGWAVGAVTNADLDFSTRDAAAAVPETLRADMVVAQATGVLASAWDVPMAHALEQRKRAAVQAGVSLEQLAATVVSLLSTDD